MGKVYQDTIQKCDMHVLIFMDSDLNVIYLLNISLRLIKIHIHTFSKM